MMRAIVSEFITLDGVFEGPDGVEGFAHRDGRSATNGAPKGTGSSLTKSSKPTPSSWEGSPTKCSPRHGRPEGMMPVSPTK